MANVLKLLPEFSADVEVGSSISKRWNTWLSEFSMFIVANGITDDTRKRALLLCMAGSRVREIFATLSDTGEDKDFTLAKIKLTDYFKPQENKRYEIYKFRQLWQHDDESLDAFHTRLRTMTTNCEFANVELEIEQQIIVGGKSSNIRKKALRDPSYKLKDMLVDGGDNESSLFQSKDIEGGCKEEFIEKFSTDRKKFERKCFNCGGPFPHNKSYPAKGKQCDTCHKYNHFSSCCRQGYYRKFTLPNHTKSSRFHETKEKEQLKSVMDKFEAPLNADESHSGSDDEYLFLLKVSDDKSNTNTKIIINGKMIKMTVDTGATINVIDERTFSVFKNVKLEKSRVKAYTYGSTQPVKFHGKFKALIETRHSFVVADIYVGKEYNSGCLLSLDTAQELGLITLHLESLLNVEHKTDENVFKGLGKLKGNNVTHIDETVSLLSLKQSR